MQDRAECLQGKNAALEERLLAKEALLVDFSGEQQAWRSTETSLKDKISDLEEMMRASAQRSPLHERDHFQKQAAQSVIIPVSTDLSQIRKELDVDVELFQARHGIQNRSCEVIGDRSVRPESHILSNN